MPVKPTAPSAFVMREASPSPVSWPDGLIERVLQVRDEHPGKRMVVAEWTGANAAVNYANRLRKNPPDDGRWKFSGVKSGDGSELHVTYVGPKLDDERP